MICCRFVGRAVRQSCDEQQMIENGGSRTTARAAGFADVSSPSGL
jgi:hypothetical protein